MPYEWNMIIHGPRWSTRCMERSTNKCLYLQIACLHVDFIFVYFAVVSLDEIKMNSIIGQSSANSNVKTTAVHINNVVECQLVKLCCFSVVYVPVK